MSTPGQPFVPGPMRSGTLGSNRIVTKTAGKGTPAMGKNVIRGRVVDKGVTTSESATGKPTMTVNGKTYTGNRKVELQADGVYVDGRKVD